MRRTAMLACAVVALAGCSSTASSGGPTGAPIVDDAGTDESSSAAAAAAAGGDGDGTSADDRTEGGDVAPSAAAGDRSSGDGATTGQPDSRATNGSPTGSSGGGTAGPGVDTDLPPVEVGAMYATDRSAFLAAFGVEGGAELDVQAANDALAAAVNAGNGFGGRQVTIVYHELDATSTESYSAIAQKACVAFTEDHDVVAVVGANTLMARCLADHDAIGVDNADNIGGPAFMDDVRDHYYSTSSLNYDRKAGAWLAGLGRLGYFEGGTFGLIHYDVPGMVESVDRILEPGLSERGIELEARVEVPFPDDTAGAGNTVAQIQNAVLQMQSRGVDHVMIYDVNATMPVFFMQQAQSQNYRPRYALESDSHLNFMLNNVPASQLVGSVAVGWRPIDDQLQYLGKGGEAGRCLQVLHDAGVDTPDHATLEAALNICDWWFFLDHVYDRAGGVVPPSVFSDTVDAMGSTYASARTTRTFFAAGRPHDGTAQVQPLRYDEACPCYVRDGNLIDLA